MSGFRIPTLGPKGEGWVAGQLVLILAIAASGAFELPHVALDSPLRLGSVLIGAVLMGLGGVVFLRGLRDLGGSLTAVPRPRADAELVQTGVYRRIRHPIYAGIILAALGWVILTGSWPALVLTALLAAWLDLKARLEEIWLLARHDGYAGYRARTSRFVPGIY